MQTCDFCVTRAPQLPVRIEIVRESGPIGLGAQAKPRASMNFTQARTFCSSEHVYEWLRGLGYMICNRQPTPFEAGMQPYLPSRHMGGRIGLCDGHHLGAHEWKEAWPS
ncbi:MAG: hypothetical protein ABR509_03170 [Candidatus Limnocylindria bacterium]